MEFLITVEISPSGRFGVPQAGWTVQPGRAGESYGDTFHSDTGIRVGFGTLPEYRAMENAIEVTLKLGRAEVRIRDNFAFLKIDASSSSEAFNLATRELDRFFQHLSLSQGTVFTYEVLIIETSDRRTYPVPTEVILSKITMYNLDHLRDEILEAQSYQDISDERLSRALEYFELALILYQTRGEIAGAFNRHHTQVIASVFLNLWKAMSSIVGDPNEDRDYQSRYRTLGFDQRFFEEKIEKVRDLRNNYDVAHYVLDGSGIERLEADYGEVQQIVTDVLKRYREFVLSSSQRE